MLWQPVACHSVHEFRGGYNCNDDLEVFCIVTDIRAVACMFDIVYHGTVHGATDIIMRTCRRAAPGTKKCDMVCLSSSRQ